MSPLMAVVARIYTIILVGTVVSDHVPRKVPEKKAKGERTLPIRGVPGMIELRRRSNLGEFLVRSSAMIAILEWTRRSLLTMLPRSISGSNEFSDVDAKVLRAGVSNKQRQRCLHQHLGAQRRTL